MKVAVVGSRGFCDYEKLKSVLDAITDIEMIISGGASGADSLAEKWARENNIPTCIYKPDWAKHGRSAGFIRNRQIIESSDFCVAFWDGHSKGTKNSIDWCAKLNKKLKVIR